MVGFGPHSFHKPNMLSAHDHKFSLPFWWIIVALNIIDLYPQRNLQETLEYSKSDNFKKLSVLAPILSLLLKICIQS